MKYYKKFKDTDSRFEIDYEAALATLLTTFRNNDMTRDMLTTPNNINCRFAYVYVEDDTTKPTMVLMSGLWNMLPDGVEYDEDGNRL